MKEEVNLRPTTLSDAPLSIRVEGYVDESPIPLPIELGSLRPGPFQFRTRIPTVTGSPYKSASIDGGSVTLEGPSGGSTLTVAGTLIVPDGHAEVTDEIRLVTSKGEFAVPVHFRPIPSWQAQPEAVDFDVVAPGTSKQARVLIQLDSPQTLRVVKTPATVTASIRQIGQRAQLQLTYLPAKSSPVLLNGAVVLARTGASQIVIPVVGASVPPASKP